jgi:hypothetical protein
MLLVPPVIHLSRFARPGTDTLTGVNDAGYLPALDAIG